MAEDERFLTRNNPSGMTLLEFREKYDYIVRVVVQRMIPRDLADVDDMSSWIWLQFMEGRSDGRSYLDIYDPKKGAPTTFMWEFTKVRCKQYLSKCNRTPTARAVSIQNQESEDPIPGVVNAETTSELGFDESPHVEFQDLLKRATAAIRAHKVRGKRDLKWVWELVLKQYRQDQIAEAMNLSEGTISICMDLIRQIPEVQELRNWAVEHGLIKDDSLILR